MVILLDTEGTKGFSLKIYHFHIFGRYLLYTQKDVATNEVSFLRKLGSAISEIILEMILEMISEVISEIISEIAPPSFRMSRICHFDQMALVPYW